MFYENMPFLKNFYSLYGCNNQQLTSTTTEVVVVDDGLAFF